jgi:hypothetical protein
VNEDIAGNATRRDRQTGAKLGPLDEEPVEEWVERISARADVSVSEVRRILDRYNIAPARALPPRRHLLLKAVHFAGIKDLAVDGHRDVRRLVPFSFTHEFGPGLTAFGTRNQNEAGKTSLLEVIIWGLRGRCNLQVDVRRWIHQASLEIELAGDKILVGWTITNGRPRGQVLLLNETSRPGWTDIDDRARAHFREQVDRTFGDVEQQSEGTGAHPRGESSGNVPLSHALTELGNDGVVELARFDGDVEFEAVMGAIMLERLGFQRLPQWQRAPAATQVEDTDGTLGEHGWAAWSQALVITNPATKIPLGEEQYVAGRLLQVYLGTAWAAPAAVAAARKSQLESRLGVLRRRVANVEAERGRSLRTLRAEVEELSARLAVMPEVDAVAEADRLLAEIDMAAEEYAQAQQAFTLAAATYGATAKLLEAAEADEYALGQAAVTKRFWHSLKPSCCPRCDAAVEEDRWRQELEGHCSLCGSDVALADGDAATVGQPEPLSGEEAARMVRERVTNISVDELDDLSAVRLQVAQLRSRASSEDRAMDETQAARDATRARLEAARQAGQAVRPGAARARRDAELAVARAQGQLNERSRSGADDPDAVNLRETQAALSVVTAAERVARDRRDSDQAQLLGDVSEVVTDLGRRLGVAQLESATLRGNLNMPVIKGGQRHNFGSLTEGEVLRLKIALVIALLRVGTSAGVGRHPGLLLIDSLGREEVNPDDLVTMLQELQQIALDAQLQIVATSAYGDVLERALPPTSLRLAGVGEWMW